MDSLTQLTLGAAVGEAVLGRKIGHKAILWGAALGTFPDLDVFVPFFDPVKDFTYHRSFSHSIFVLSALTPLFVWLILKLHPKTGLYERNWTWLVWLVFMTHILLDCFTVYGTQIFWPLWHYPAGWASLFIIDPFYTLPLVIGVILALVMTRQTNRGHLANRAGLVVSTLYLAWSVGARLYVRVQVEQSLARQNVPYEKLLVSAGPFNTALWRIVGMQADGNYFEGYYSLLDRSGQATLKHYRSRVDLLRGVEQHWPVQRLQWFTKGYFKVWQDGDRVVVSDLRMGYEPDYVFSFGVGRIGNPHVKAEPAVRIEPKRDLSRLKSIWARIWSSGV
ncbi:MAG: hydrolase [Desulfuromonas sp.]|mgnify:CR=1 FL=1|nr:MAG: hydrolase [Desulfuromonas sp.]